MKICVVTGTRAEFGLLQGLMKLIDGSQDYELQVVVTGAHLLEEFGYTVDSITDAGFAIDANVPQITHATSGSDVATQVGAGTVGFTKVFSNLGPDALVVLGDRYEMLAASISAFFLNIPILHIHGGEVTNGAFDDTIRHVITKLASLHCVAHDHYARRVVQLGERPESVHVVGALGVDQLSRTGLLSKQELELELGIELKEVLFLVTYHPVTSGLSDAIREIQQLIAALERFPDATVVVTMPSADPDYQKIASALMDAASRHPGTWLFTHSLGQVKYWSLMRLATAIVGNSSSGILEAPSFATPTVNIGPRQTGRIMARSVVSCAPDGAQIFAAINKVIERDFRQSLQDVSNPMGRPGASERIFLLIPLLQTARLRAKVFFDLKPYESGQSLDSG